MFSFRFSFFLFLFFLKLIFFFQITSSYYRGAHGIIVVFDVTNTSTFENIQKWLQEIDRYAVDGVPRLLVGNKCDLAGERKVSREEAEEFAQSLGLTYLETSAKSAENVHESFVRLSNAIRDGLNQ